MSGDWLDVAEDLLPAYLEMLPRLQAEEDARTVDMLVYAAGRMQPNDARSFMANLRRQMHGGQEPRAPKASLDQLRAMGIQVVME